MLPTLLALQVSKIDALLSLTDLAAKLKAVSQSPAPDGNDYRKALITRLLACKEAYADVRRTDVGLAATDILALNCFFDPEPFSELVQLASTADIPASTPRGIALLTTIANVRLIARVLTEQLLTRRHLAVAKDEMRLSLTTIDSRHVGISLDRFAHALAGTQTLLDAICDAHAWPHTKCRIDLIESGSGIEVTLAVAAAAGGVLLAVMRFVWDRYRHVKNIDLERDLVSVASTLEVIAAIEARVRDGSLTPEAGQICKNAVLRSCLELLGTGTLPTLMVASEATPITNVDLLESAVSPKLLTEARPPALPDDDGDDRT